jgi:hypothetical protein
MSTREIKKYEFILEAVTPIAHHQEVIGNQAIAMRRKVRQPDGWAHVPAVSGDTMRHGLREAAAYAFLDAAGLLDDGRLSESVLRLLFAGGMVTGRGDASMIKLDHYREMTELMPSLAILGGCVNNRVVPGRLTVDDAILICRESTGIVPEWMHEHAGTLDSCRAHVEIAQRVRMDPTLDPAKRHMISAGAQVELNKKLSAGEDAHDTDDVLAREGARSTMMPRTHECVAAGSLFAWSVEAVCLTDLDVDVFHTMIASFLSSARVGGKRGTGHGLLRPVHARGIIVNRPSERMHAVDATALAPKIGEMFRSHVKERTDRIKRFLGEVDA